MLNTSQTCPAETSPGIILAKIIPGIWIFFVMSGPDPSHWNYPSSSRPVPTEITRQGQQTVAEDHPIRPRWRRRIHCECFPEDTHS